MRDDLTVVYITSNREDESFERKIIESMKEAIGGLPVISVSQKPLDFGENICIGDVGAKPENVLRQLILGAKAAKTKFVAVGESDFLYPKEFFEFVPPRDDTFYYPDNVYIWWTHHSRFYRKNLREMLSVTNREHFINVLEKVLDGLDGHIASRVGKFTSKGAFWTDIPLVTFKTRNGMHWRSPYKKDGWKRELPQWGTADNLREKYLS